MSMRLSTRRMSRTSVTMIALAVIFGELTLAYVVTQGHIFSILVLLGGLVAIVAVYQRPAIGAALILALAPLEGVLQFRGHSLAKFVTVLCIMVFLAQIVIAQRDIKFDLTILFIVPFVLWTLISIVWSPNQLTLSKWVSFALQISLYFILINLVQSEDDLNLALWGHILGGIVLAILLTNSVVSQNFLRKGTIAGLGVNLVARMIALNLLLSLFLYQSEHRQFGRAILLVSMILSIIGVVVSLSRGAWVAVVLSIVTMVMVYAINRRLQVKLANIVWLFAIGLVSFYTLDTFLLSEHGAEKLTTRFQSGITLEDNAGGRFDIWIVGWNMFLDSPLLGHGFESFADRFLIYAERGNLSAFGHQESKTAHNSFVGIIAQFGLIGISLFLAVLASVFDKVRSLSRSRPPNVPALASVSALIVFLLIANFVDYAVARKYLWYVLGIITLLAEYRTDDQAMESPRLSQHS